VHFGLAGSAFKLFGLGEAFIFSELFVEQLRWLYHMACIDTLHTFGFGF
jgi:hypothetical protein